MIYPLVAAIFVSLLSLLGVVFTNIAWLKKSSKYFVALAAGTLIADVFFHILPEVAEKGFTGEHALTIVSAILFSIFLEGVVRWHHSHSEHDLEQYEHKEYIGWLSLTGDGIHNFIDGIAIAASFTISFEVGIITTLAIILHEIPQEIAHFGVLLHSGFTRGKALLFNLFSGLTALAGVLVFAIIPEYLNEYVTMFAAGSLLYIALADMIPEVHENNHKKTDYVNLLVILVGILLIYLLTYLGV